MHNATSPSGEWEHKAHALSHSTANAQPTAGVLSPFSGNMNEALAAAADSASSLYPWLAAGGQAGLVPVPILQPTATVNPLTGAPLVTFVPGLALAPLGALGMPAAPGAPPTNQNIPRPQAQDVQSITPHSFDPKCSQSPNNSFSHSLSPTPTALASNAERGNVPRGTPSPSGSSDVGPSRVNSCSASGPAIIGAQTVEGHHNNRKLGSGSSSDSGNSNSQQEYQHSSPAASIGTQSSTAPGNMGTNPFNPACYIPMFPYSFYSQMAFGDPHTSSFVRQPPMESISSKLSAPHSLNPQSPFPKPTEMGTNLQVQTGSLSSVARREPQLPKSTISNIYPEVHSNRTNRSMEHHSLSSKNGKGAEYCAVCSKGGQIEHECDCEECIALHNSGRPFNPASTPGISTEFSAIRIESGSHARGSFECKGLVDPGSHGHYGNGNLGQEQAEWSVAHKRMASNDESLLHDAPGAHRHARIKHDQSFSGQHSQAPLERPSHVAHFKRHNWKPVSRTHSDLSGSKKQTCQKLERRQTMNASSSNAARAHYPRVYDELESENRASLGHVPTSLFGPLSLHDPMGSAPPLGRLPLPNASLEHHSPLGGPATPSLSQLTLNSDADASSLSSSLASLSHLCPSPAPAFSFRSTLSSSSPIRNQKDAVVRPNRETARVHARHTRHAHTPAHSHSFNAHSNSSSAHASCRRTGSMGGGTLKRRTPTSSLCPSEMEMESEIVGNESESGIASADLKGSFSRDAPLLAGASWGKQDLQSQEQLQLGLSASKRSVLDEVEVDAHFSRSLSKIKLTHPGTPTLTTPHSTARTQDLVEEHFAKSLALLQTKDKMKDEKRNETISKTNSNPNGSSTLTRTPCNHTHDSPEWPSSIQSISQSEHRASSGTTTESGLGLFSLSLSEHSCEDMAGSCSSINTTPGQSHCTEIAPNPALSTGSMLGERDSGPGSPRAGYPRRGDQFLPKDYLQQLSTSSRSRLARSDRANTIHESSPSMELSLDEHFERSLARYRAISNPVPSPSVARVAPPISSSSHHSPAISSLGSTIHP